MASRTQVLESVKSLRWRDVEAGLAVTPKLTAYRDERGRNFLHICCCVKVKEKKLSSADSIRTADVLLSAGIDINREAFREHDFKATPLWYAVSRGENLQLAIYCNAAPTRIIACGLPHSRMTPPPSSCFSTMVPLSMRLPRTRPPSSAP